MNPIILLAVFAITVIGAFIFGRATAAPLDASGATGDSEKLGKKSSVGETLQDKIKELEARLSEAGKRAKRHEDELKKLRDDAKDAKQKAHDRGERLDQVRKELEEERRRVKNLGSIEVARKEMLASKEEVERLKAELAERGHAPAIAKAPVAAPIVETPTNTIDAKTLEAQLDAKDEQTRRALQEQAQSLKASFDAQVSEERDRYKGEIRSLQKRLRTALRDADKARRSAEANDRAYLVLKSQLEGTLDRLAFHDPTLRRPDALDPPTSVPDVEPSTPPPENAS